MCGERELRSKFDDAQEISRLNAFGFQWSKRSEKEKKQSNETGGGRPRTLQ